MDVVGDRPRYRVCLVCSSLRGMRGSRCVEERVGESLGNGGYQRCMCTTTTCGGRVGGGAGAGADEDEDDAVVVETAEDEAVAVVAEVLEVFPRPRDWMSAHADLCCRQSSSSSRHQTVSPARMQRKSRETYFDILRSVLTRSEKLTGVDTLRKTHTIETGSEKIMRHE